MIESNNDVTLAFLGQTELLIILAVVMVFFGGRKLPELARAAGSSITQFKKGLKEDEKEPLDGPQPAGADGAGGDGAAGGDGKQP
ncbi:MAG: twin-arginine translocase TatA/TatE family subunit [Planctomycetota bacterium]